MTRCSRTAGTVRVLAGATCAVVICIGLGAQFAQGQDKPSLQELLGRAQSQSEKKAVEELIDKLQGPKPTPRQGPAVEAAKPGVKAQEEPRTQQAKPAAGEAAKAAGGDAEKAAVSTTPAAGTDKAQDQSASAREQALPVEKQTAPLETTSKVDAEGVAKPLALSAEVAVERAERKQLPSVDLEILFEFDSVKMTPAAIEALTPLGRALSDERLADGQFLIAGHTDGKGKTSYNRELSQRRAEAVREFLVANFKIDGSRLVAQGFGESRLKNPQQPRAAENRRVQIVNFGSAAASR
jgi:outer membrane protein OmpA-like peptidoglycan-associated protein